MASFVDYQNDIERQQRQRQIAEAMQQQFSSNLQQPSQVVGGRVLTNSAPAALASTLGSVISSYKARNATRKADEIKKAKSDEVAAALKAYQLEGDDSKKGPLLQRLQEVSMSPDDVARATITQAMTPKQRKTASVAPGAVLVDENDGSEIYKNPARDPAPRLRSVEWKDTGTHLVPVWNDTGEDVVGLKPKLKSATPTANANNDNRKFSQADKLRDEYNAQSKEFIQIGDAFTRLNEAAKQPSAAGDLSLIFQYMKMLDPGSVVREQEFANAQNAAGVPDRVRNAYNKAMTGERLNPDQRADFLNQAKGLYSGQRERHEKNVKSRYKALAERHKIDPNDVVGDLDIIAPQPEVPAAVGWSVREVK